MPAGSLAYRARGAAGRASYGGYDDFDQRVHGASRVVVDGDIEYDLDADAGMSTSIGSGIGSGFGSSIRGANPRPAARKSASARRAAPIAGAGPEIHPGALVTHVQFGLGRVIEARGRGTTRKLLIEFSTVGLKTVLERFVEPADLT
jgi:hypothetical protein